MDQKMPFPGTHSVSIAANAQGDAQAVAPAAPSDMTFISNEAGRTLRERFAALLNTDTQQFDCLVGYFFISGV